MEGGGRAFSLRKHPILRLSAYLANPSYPHPQAGPAPAKPDLSRCLGDFVRALGLASPLPGGPEPRAASASGQREARQQRPPAGTRSAREARGPARPDPNDPHNAEAVMRSLPVSRVKPVPPRPTLPPSSSLSTRPQQGAKAEKKRAAGPAGPRARKPALPKVVCRYFMEGLCSKGEACTFSHAAVPRKTVEEAKQGKEVCKFFILGSCLKGEKCIYSHDLSHVPCRFFHLWKDCSAGAACRFSHQPIDEATRLRLLQEATPSRSNSPSA